MTDTHNSSSNSASEDGDAENLGQLEVGLTGRERTKHRLEV